ncbi:MAG: hypothetical protein JW873_04185 [Candidatus Saganbacteria bacterium]|nr:hypothetical protein [Candidatus Saganbacteria bacterium]
MKKLVILLIFAFIWPLLTGAQAFRLENLPFFSNFHIGCAAGIGTGLNFGARGKFLPGNLKIGAEIEQLITDVNYSVTVSTRKYGGIISCKINDFWTLNGHYGIFECTTNKDLPFSNNSNNYILIANTSYPGNYYAVSVDYIIGEYFTISPKLSVNAIQDKGSLAEFDLNVGRTF